MTVRYHCLKILSFAICTVSGGEIRHQSPPDHNGGAGGCCPSLRHKRLSPHVLRHTAAMELLQAGVDLSVIALWLGYESILTTQACLHAHIALKTAALAELQPHNMKRPAAFKPEDRLLAFLEAL